MSKKVSGYEDKNYKQNEKLHDSLHQAFLLVKNDKYGNHGWNVPLEKMSGVTLKTVGTEQFALTYHRIEVGTQELMARKENNAEEFMKEVEKALKKKFKELTRKASFYEES